MKDRPSFAMQQSDLKSITDESVPDCTKCKSTETVAIETTAGNWQVLCLTCLRRFGTTWKPMDPVLVEVLATIRRHIAYYKAESIRTDPEGGMGRHPTEFDHYEPPLKRLIAELIGAVPPIGV